MSNKDVICDACLKGKSHQLPNPKFLVNQVAPLSLFSLMYGVLYPCLLEDTIVMFVSLMASTNLHGFICFAIKSKDFLVFP